MRRLTLALLGTTVGTALLVGLKTESLATPLGLTVPAPSEPTTGDGTIQSGQSADSSGPSPVPLPGATTGTPATTGPNPTPTRSGSTVPPASPTTTRTTTAPPASRTITGTAYAAVWNGRNYGNMQVKIVVTGTHIDDIVTIKQSSEPKSVSTSLRQQALTAQSASVGNVSGATASSNAYKQSLASAIAQI